MIRSIVKLSAAATLIVAGTVALPATSATAGSSVQVTFVSPGESHTFSYSCTNSTHTYGGDEINSVSNGCGTRVWLHGNLNGSGAAYCINPGAIAYNFGTGFVQFQITTNGAACDAGHDVIAAWEGAYTNYDCVDGSTHIESQDGYDEFLSEIDNDCNVRVWIHENSDGSGAAVCISPGEVLTDINLDFDVEFYQFQVSANQDSC